MDELWEQAFYAAAEEQCRVIESTLAEKQKLFAAIDNQTRYATRHQEDIKRWAAQYYRKNKGRFSAKARQFRSANPNYAAEYRIRNAHKIAAQRATWAKQNPDKVRALCANRRAARYRATPKWADQAAIRRVYMESTKYGLQVDHVVPLRHSLVCGLHIVANLQLLNAEENQRKGNRYWPGMP